MSNMATSPGSRPLEQLKVAELRDELRKRGLSFKGVKKELFERLEEAVKMEEQEGVVHGEHEATQEGTHKMGTLDDSEDVEGEEEMVDRSKDEASKSPDTTTACQSSTSLDTPLPTTEDSTPFSEGTHDLLGVSAPDEVPGSNEEREQLCTVGGANVEINNDVPFVDNAVSGNGDAMVSPESVANVADILDPCKDTSGVEHVERGNDEKEPAIVISELADSESIDFVPESGFASSVTENVISDVLDPPVENGDPFVAVDNAVCANDASGNVESTNLADSESIDFVPESGFASSVTENVISDVLDPPVENGDPFVAVDNAVRANDASGNDVESTNLKEDQLSIPDTSIENPSLETDDKSLMQPLTQALDSGNPTDTSREEEAGSLITESSIVSCSLQLQEVYEQSAGLISEELERPNVDERDLITNEEKSDVKLDQVVKQEIKSEGGLEKNAVKMEPMDIETDLEERHEVICEVKMESQIEKEDHTQLEILSEEFESKEVRSDHDYSRRSRGEESASRLPDAWKKDKEDDVNVKPVEDVSQDRINLKRKDNVPETDVKQQEPAKRMRRWNSGKEVVVDALKPLTTDSMKEIMLPDSVVATAQRLTPKAVSTSRALPPKVKEEPEPSDNTRTVPPSTRAPSNSLKVERFVRPFTLKAAKDLLAEFGPCVDFWMDQIKTHCFVRYSSVNEAIAARNGLYGRQWPPSVGNCLVAEFVDANEVQIRSEGLAEKAHATPTAALIRVSNSTHPQPPQVAQSSSTIRSDSNTLPSPRFSRGAQLPPVPKKDPEPAVVTLEDLFCKTKAKPHIYYLPLTDEQVAEKIKNKQAVR